MQVNFMFLSMLKNRCYVKFAFNRLQLHLQKVCVAGTCQFANVHVQGVPRRW